MTAWGYARVSTPEQDEAPQVAALLAAGVAEDRIVIEHASGARADRPQLVALLARVQPGDVLTVWKLDRLGRSLSHLVQTVDDLGRRGVEFRSLTEGMDTTTATGRLTFQIVGAMAEFERELTRERTRSGLEAARASGKTLGRRTVVDPVQVGLIHEMHRSGATQTTIARSTKLSRATVGRVLRGEIASLAPYSPGSDTDHLPLYLVKPTRPHLDSDTALDGPEGER